MARRVDQIFPPYLAFFPRIIVSCTVKILALRDTVTDKLVKIEAKFATWLMFGGFWSTKSAQRSKICELVNVSGHSEDFNF